MEEWHGRAVVKRMGSLLKIKLLKIGKQGCFVYLKKITEFSRCRLLLRRWFGC